MKSINIGKLNNKIAIWGNIAQESQYDELGNDLVSEQQLFTVWANIESRTGSLLSGRTADTLLSKTTHKIIIRYNKSIKPEHWIMYDGRRFDIDYISDPDFSKRYLEVFVQEVVE